MGGPGAGDANPEITRFFMTIPEAGAAGAAGGGIGETGSIFVLDMGTPVRIVDLARNLIQLAGSRRTRRSRSSFALRPGEKLYEDCDERGSGDRCTRPATISIMVTERDGDGRALFLKQLKRAGCRDGRGEKRCATRCARWCRPSGKISDKAG